jgi:hypothetical protein
VDVVDTEVNGIEISQATAKRNQEGVQCAEMGAGQQARRKLISWTIQYSNIWLGSCGEPSRAEPPATLAWSFTVKALQQTLFHIVAAYDSPGQFRVEVERVLYAQTVTSFCSERTESHGATATLRFGSTAPARASTVSPCPGHWPRIPCKIETVIYSAQ